VRYFAPGLLGDVLVAGDTQRPLVLGEKCRVLRGVRVVAIGAVAVGKRGVDMGSLLFLLHDVVAHVADVRLVHVPDRAMSQAGQSHQSDDKEYDTHHLPSWLSETEE
jgi:hypothetical protein